MQDPALIGLALAIAAMTVVAHLGGAMLTRQPPATGLLASAQLGVPAAIVALGLSAHVITAAQGAVLALTRGSPGIYNIAEDDGAVVISKAREQLGFNPSFRLSAA